jgi:NADH-quinone oxidoreductase subunit G
LDQAKLVVACTAFRGPALEAAADLMLPIAGFAETSGTFVNAELMWQGFRGAVAPPGEARPGWKVLRVLGNLLGLDEFEYNTSAQVLDELKVACEAVKPDNSPRGDLKVEPRAAGLEGLFRIGSVPIYAVDPLVRHAGSLQRTPSAGAFGVYLNPADAADLGLTEGDSVQAIQNGSAAQARVTLDGAVPAGCARVPAGVPGSESLGEQGGPVKIQKV